MHLTTLATPRILHYALALLLAAMLLGGCATPMHVYLTWQGDTSTTMTVNYQTRDDPGISLVYYDTEPRNRDIEAYQFRAEGSRHHVPGMEPWRTVHTVELTGLEPGQTYYFIAGDPEIGFSREKKFRTVPGDDSELRFIVGGDMTPLPLARRMQSRAAERDPHFAVIGGDLAYADGKIRNYPIWDMWLFNWGHRMRTPDGHMIPMVLAIGNHEVNDKEGPPEIRAPFYYGYFAQAGNTYFTRTFGSRVAIIILDSGHIHPHGGAQTEWLEEQLQALADFPYRFPVYHVPLYTSYRSFNDSRSVAGREHWEPLFNKYGVTAGFEHHDHTFKRTKPVRGGQVDPEGIVYLGDGSMGVPRRPIRNWDLGYLEVASDEPHFWFLTVTDEGVLYEAVDQRGQVFDTYSTPAPALAAE